MYGGLAISRFYPAGFYCEDSHLEQVVSGEKMGCWFILEGRFKSRRVD